MTKIASLKNFLPIRKASAEQAPQFKFGERNKTAGKKGT
jgi:hypothetical protein